MSLNTSLNCTDSTRYSLYI